MAESVSYRVFSQADIHRKKKKKIGEGGFAKVYDGTILPSDTCCAIKKFKRDKVKPRQIEREANIWAELSHKRIVKFEGIYYEEPIDRLFPSLILERMETNLSKFLDEGQDIALSKKIDILHQVAEGIVFLHSQCLIHGDLTASNILLAFVDKDIIAKIGDFGVSRMIAPIQETSTISIGTESYMPPEMYEEPPCLSSKVDSFSFGVLIIHTLSHKFPKPLHVLDGKRQRSEFERRERFLNKLGEECNDLIELIKRCLDNAPAARPDAEQLLTGTEVNFYLSCKTNSCTSSSNSSMADPTTFTTTQLQDRTALIFHDKAKVTVNTIITHSTFEKCEMQFNRGTSTELVEETPQKAIQYDNAEFHQSNDLIQQGQCDQLASQTADSRNTGDDPIHNCELTLDSMCSAPITINSDLNELPTKTESGQEFCRFIECDKVGLIIGSHRINLQKIEQTTGTHIHYDNKIKCFVINGGSEARKQGVKELEMLISTKMEYAAAIEDFQKRAQAPFTVTEKIPKVLKPGMLCGRKRENLKILQSISRCHFTVKEDYVIIKGETHMQCTDGANQLKILVSKIAKNLSPKLLKSVTFLSRVFDEEKVHLIKLKNPYPSGKMKEKFYHTLQLCRKKQVEGSQSVDIHQFLYYSEIREKIKDAVVELLSADAPIILHFEVKLGKVAWDFPVVIPDIEVPLSSIDKDGNILLEEFQVKSSQPPPKSYFLSSLAEDSLNFEELPKLGEETSLIIQVVVTKEQYFQGGIYPVINVRCRKGQKGFELLEVSPKKEKDLIIDCICLEGSLDLRIKCKFAINEDIEVAQSYQAIGRDVVMSLQESETGQISLKPRNEDFAIVYFARRKKTVYEYYYESCPYLLTHIDIDECLELMKNVKKSMYNLDMIKDEAVLICSPQLLVNFGRLSDPEASLEKIFAFCSCKPPKHFKVKTEKPTVDSVLKEMDQFISCCLYLSINNTKL